MKENKNQEMKTLHDSESDEYEYESNFNIFKVVILISIIGFVAIVILSGNNNPTNTILIPQEDGDELVLSLSSLGTKANFYKYSANGVEIHFFAVLGTDSEPHVAFDACDSCYSEKLGYAQNDVLMVCRNCGNTFLIDGIGTVNLQGGCWPSYLPITINDDEIRINILDVEQGRYLFA
ncbi:MAG: DUF2318 domain-containing protein [Candidatus Hodarchaeales archaeon]|jgi:uncharacterized membrane protein